MQARREQDAIKREHRAQRRHQEEPSPTPSLSQLMRAQDSSLQQAPASSSQESNRFPITVSSSHSNPASHHPPPTSSSPDLPRNAQLSHRRHLAPSPAGSEGSYGSNAALPAAYSPSPNRRSPPPQDSILPPIPFESIAEGNDLSKPALTDEEWSLLRRFHMKLREPRLKTCERCRERWINMDLNANGVCARCLDKDPLH